MHINIDRHRVGILLILLLGFGLRFYGYDSYPVMGETKDEFAWTWLGESLLVGQAPKSWTIFDHYPSATVQEIDGYEFKIAQPVFDNPPLFSLIPGLMVLIGEESRDIEIPSIRLIRFPLLFIGTAQLLLVYLFAKNIWGKEVGLLAGLLLATVPSFVFASRMVLAENLVTLLLLLTLWILSRNPHGSTKRGYYLIGLLCGLAVLTKVLGIFVFLSAIGLIILAHKHYPKGVVTTSLAFILTFSMWIIYALLFDFGLFVETQLTQGSLAIGLGSVMNLFLRTFIVDTPIFDGWQLLGWVILFGYTLQRDKQGNYAYLRVPFTMWLLVLVLAVGEQTWHGWYRYPMFPLMAIGMGLVIWRARDSFYHWIGIVALGLLPTLRMIIVHNELHVSAWMTRVVVLCLLGLPVVSQFVSHKKLFGKSAIYYLMVAVVVIVNSVAVLTFSDSMHSVDYRYFYPHGM